MVDRKAELAQIKKEEDQLKATLWKYKSQINNIYNESEDLQEKLNDIEIECLERNNQSCLNYIDGYLVALNAIKRKIFKAKYDMDSQCFETIPYSLRPIEESEWDNKSQESLNEFKKYVRCSEPLYRQVLTHFHEELSLKNEVNKKLSEFFKE